MERDRRLSLTVGAFVLAAGAAFAVTVLSLSSEQGMFRARYDLQAYYTNVQGLLPGAAVRLAGTRVGQVKKVELATRPDGEPAVLVALQIDEAVHERITADSVARIGTVGLLGDQIVEIAIGTLESPPLEPGAEIRTLEPFDISQVVSQAPQIIDTIRSIEEHGSRALQQIETLASNLNDTVEDFQTKKGGQGLAQAMQGFGDIIGEVQQGDGALHALIYEPYEGTAVANMDRAVGSLANVMGEVERGDGFLHSLIYDDATDQDVLFQVLEAGARLNSILGKIDRGEGSLGLLLNDPTLYEEIKLLVGGAARSRVVRTMVNMVSDDAPPQQSSP